MADFVRKALQISKTVLPTAELGLAAQQALRLRK
jgi:hypothetical protein